MCRLLLLSCIFLLFGCSEKQVTPASFYYWKTDFKLSAIEMQTLRECGTKELFIRMFDVDKQNDSIVPLGVLTSADSIPGSLHIVPVVFITNRTFLEMNEKECDQLTDHVISRINSLLAGRNFSEIQIDCDWSEKTKENYFGFLQALKKRSGQKTLSVTIRLHQVKYPLRSGIPPADKGMLMFYNMGDAHSLSAQNSIYNKESAGKYVSYVSSYALPLDLALPVFSWQLQFRDQQLVGIVPKDRCPDIHDSTLMTKTAEAQIFEIKSSFLHRGHYFKEGDQLKTERITKEDLKEMASLLADHKGKWKPGRIVFFDLDAYNLKSIEHETIKETLDILK